MLIEGNVVWLDFIRIWAPMFGCRRTRLHSPQSEIFPVEEIVFSCNFIPTSYFILNHIYSWVGWVLI